MPRLIVRRARPMSKASAVALTLPKPGAPVSTWADDGYECSFYRSPNGVGWVTVTGPGMGQPWHEVADTEGKARSLAKAAIPQLRLGKSPRNGVFKMLAKAKKRDRGVPYQEGGQWWIIDHGAKRRRPYKPGHTEAAPAPTGGATSKKPTKAQRNAKRLEQNLARRAAWDRDILYHRAAMDHHAEHPDVPEHASAHGAHMEAQAAIGRPDYPQKREAADNASATADGAYGEWEDKFWEADEHTNQAQSHRRDANGLERLAHAVDHVHRRAGGTGEHKAATELRGLAARHRRAERAHDVASRHIGLDKSEIVGQDLDTPEQRHAHAMTMDAHPRSKREEGFLKGKGIPEAAVALSRSWPETEHSPRLHKSASWTHHDHAEARDDHRATAKGLERMASAAERAGSHHASTLRELATRHHDAADAHHDAAGEAETRSAFPKGYLKRPAVHAPRAHAASAAAEPRTPREHRYVGSLRKAVLAKARRAPDGTLSKDGRKIKQNGKWVPNPNRAGRKRAQEPAALDAKYMKPFVGDEHADPEGDTQVFGGSHRQQLIDAHDHHVRHMNRLVNMIYSLEDQGRFQEARGLRHVHGAHDHARFSFHAAVKEHERGNHTVAQKHARNGRRAAREVAEFGTPVMKARRLMIKARPPKTDVEGAVKFIGMSKRTRKYPKLPPAMPGSFGGDVSYLHHRRADHAGLESWAYGRARRTRDPLKRKILQYHGARHMVAGQHLEHALQAHEAKHPQTAALIQQARSSSDTAYAAGTHHMRDRTLGGRIRKVGQRLGLLKAKKRPRGARRPT